MYLVIGIMSNLVLAIPTPSLASTVSAVVMTLLIICAYVLVGRRLLVPLPNFMLNIASVAIVTILGLAVVLTLGDPNGVNLNTAYYGGHTTVLYILLTAGDIVSIPTVHQQVIICTIVSVVPSLLVLIGRMWKQTMVRRSN